MICARCCAPIDYAMVHPSHGVLCVPCASALPDCDLPPEIHDARMYLRSLLAQLARRKAAMGRWLSFADVRGAS